MKKVLFFFIFLLVVGKGNACINGYIKIPGVQLTDPEDHDMIVMKPYIYIEELQAYIASEEKKLKNGLDSTNADLVAAYLYDKRFSKALALSVRLYEKFPETYNVIINYAVALELNGNYTMALEILKKAIQINPSSHYGSEWMHEKILEFIVSGSKDYSRSVLGYDFGNQIVPVYNGVKEPNAYGLKYQLNERIFFVNKPDTLFGSTLFDLANICMTDNYHSEKTQELYELAIDYGYNTALTQKRILFAKKKNYYYELQYSPYSDELIEKTMRDINILETPLYNRFMIFTGFAAVFLFLLGIGFFFSRK